MIRAVLDNIHPHVMSCYCRMVHLEKMYGFILSTTYHGNPRFPPEKDHHTAMRFHQEPPYTHGSTSKTAVLLVNLGTPDAPTPAAVRRYLKQFLFDPRVVEIPKALWWCILNGIILPFRSKKSAEKYAAIWTKDGSPLKVHTEKQTQLLRGYLGEHGHTVQVAYAMRYGNPSLPHVLAQLKGQKKATSSLG